MLFLLFSLAAFCAPILTEGFLVPIDGENKQPAARPLILNEFELMQKVDSEVSDTQKVKTTTRQRFRAKWVPSEKSDKGEKTLSVKHLEFLISSNVNVPGFGPFESKQDLMKHLRNEELLYSWKNEEIVSVKGVSLLREKILDSSKDPIERATLGRILQEDLMKNNASMFLQTSYCLKDIEKKVPGDQWQSEQRNPGSVLKFQCKFSGWGIWQKELVAKVEFTIPSQKNENSLSNGKKQTVETEGTGVVFFVKSTGETLSRVNQKIRLFGEKGSDTLSTVVAETHHRP